MAKEEKGVRSTDRGVFVPLEKRMPTNKDCLHMSKDDFIKWDTKRKEVARKTQEFAASLQNEEAPVEISKEQLKANPGNGMVDGSGAGMPGHLEGAETPLVAKKKPGRPRKIE